MPSPPTHTKVARYGTWESPITPDLLTQGAISFGEITVVGSPPRVVYIENRPVEKGRAALVDIGTVEDEGKSEPADITRGEINARSAVHEYGGGALASSDLEGGIVVFASYKPGDYGVFKSTWTGSDWSAPQRITPHNTAMRYADFCIHPSNPSLILAIQEDHTVDTPSAVVNTLVIIDASDKTVKVVASGRDFYSSPRWSSDGRFVAWVSWDHPEMPWWATELWVASFDAGKREIVDSRVVAGKEGKVSVGQPIWMPGNSASAGGQTLVAFSDERNGFSLPHKINVDATPDNQLQLGSWTPVLDKPIEGDFLKPAWTLNNSSVVALNGETLACIVTRGATDTLSVLSLGSGKLTELVTPYKAFHQLRTAGSRRVVVNAGNAQQPSAIVAIDVEASSPKPQVRVLRQSSDLIASGKISPSYLSQPREISFPTTLPPQSTPALSHCILFPPRNPNYTAPRGTSPPCIFRIHGGPTSAASGGELNWETNFWTSRGYAVCFVNYGGSTGYGREFMLRLNGEWGRVDTRDCVAAARYLGTVQRPAREDVGKMTRIARQQWEGLEEVYDTAEGSVKVTMQRPQGQGGWGWWDLVTTPLAAVASLALGRLAAGVGMGTGGLLASHPTATTAGVTLAGMLAYLRLAKVRVLSESVWVSSTLGLQTETRRGLFLPFARRKPFVLSTQRSPLIPRDRILDLVLNSSISRWSVRDYLAVGVRASPRDKAGSAGGSSSSSSSARSAGRQLHTLFPHMEPRLPIVERIHSTLYPALFPSSSNPVEAARAPIPALRHNAPPSGSPLIDPTKLIISGGSAGGYTVLACLVNHPELFSSATSKYGVADLTLLAQESHKFESQYVFQLLGGTPEQVPDVYHDRSPIYKAGRIRTPLLVAQGSEDKVVPPNQSEMIVEAIKGQKGDGGEGRVKYLLFEGEGHGFRQKENVVRMLQEEEGWYRRTLGLDA
ncbi:hypothetical protein BDZ90DRAFT_280890 [Jaminaea rosea]|uniref:Uncharacterized protein n=1 Tax=Jaminaea rosea TaxID=1569628 RepID=A0A316UNM2_9BASI|nr:hypothetical protein BDZ90DRAFT_280890 [Jaminaea rosea]PWN26378.1 hypothetical protein BDZ90DRAFT_280890 [Jaminaea rosea]